MREVERLVVAVLVCLLGAACSGEEATPTRVRIPARPEDRVLEDPSRRLVYGASGELLPSDDAIAGLVLPRGLEVVRSADREHIYYSTASLQRVLEYFAPRLDTALVERSGELTSYKEAIPRGVRGGAVKLDVTIAYLTGGRVRIEIVELLPPSAREVSPEEVIERFREDLKRAD